MKKLLTIFATLITLFAVVPYALALTKQFQYNSLSGGTLTTSLVSYYNFQGNSNDYYGSNNGADTSMTYGSSYGKVGSGALFSGSSSKIALSYANIGTTISYSAWVKPSSFPNLHNTIISFMHTLLTIPPGGGSVEWWSDDNVANTVWTYAFSTGTWYHIVITQTGTTATLYVNGSSQGSKTTTNPTNTGNLNNNIGFYTGAAPWYWAGDLDEIGMWSKVLSTNEISDLYNGGAGQTMCNGTGGPVCAGGAKHKIILISLNWKPEPIA